MAISNTLSGFFGGFTSNIGKLRKAAMDYFADREQGRWYINIKRGLPPVAQRTDKSGHLEGPFHLERMLLGLIILEEDGSIARYIK